MSKGRIPLSVDRVVNAAVNIADESGLESLSMRKLGARLRVEAMSVYNYVPSKDALLDAMVDSVVAEIYLPKKDAGWVEQMKERAHSARAMFKRHPWALVVMESRKNPGIRSIRYYDAVIGCLRQNGFGIPLTAHAFATMDSYIHGFALQELNLPFEDNIELKEIADTIMDQLPTDEFPHFSEFTIKWALRPEYDFGKEFEFGLGLVLDGLAQKLKQQ